jgi:hypothetical protein
MRINVNKKERMSFSGAAIDLWSHIACKNMLIV